MRGRGKSGVRRRLPRTVGAVAVLASAAALGLAAPAGATGAPTPVTQASTSARGVSAGAINVVFPVISFTSIEGEFEIESDAEYGEQTKAIHLFVDQINDAGGINGRKINPMIVSFDPTNPNEQQALCKQWTQGNPPVFAVLDGLGTWEGVNELCITQQGHTPMLSQWIDDHQLDGPRVALPVVDGSGRRAHPGGHRAVGAELGPARTRQEGRRRGLGRGQRPGRAATPTCCRI